MSYRDLTRLGVKSVTEADLDGEAAWGEIGIFVKRMDSFKDIGQAYVNLLIGRNKELAKRRLDVCLKCIYLSKLGTCTAGCNCIVRAKNTLTQTKCPKDKW